MNSQIFWLIIGMGVVTYIPRMLPFVIFSQLHLPPFWQNVLKNVPYATLGALIVPSVFFIHEDFLFGAVGAFTAFIAAYFGANVFFVVMCSIAVLSFYSFFF
ncbi:AzlD domain-containing protein [Aeribacillus composti]|jgi:branched-subunit amino acid transport protein|uniref:AzlD domain-containing protein n=1 Tax=Aeribacillus TaxID=1055323 RepID=UPI0007B4ACB8|nr:MULTISPECIES: AzlD domain-containing protein [Aeribacillus]REJ23559.1 MAG: AzlD domain-containing protein [Bacillaceae bacterium]KZM55418.1 branched-chain amino acid transporter [Aeribacillus pallidus]MED0650101.1 AzlD domain-containing protein [Aeribacillus composti]MED1439976.1 AzlD domain-containing protein [Aeribacillus composti]MED1441975.1 AzlD domain-containing protein [Aeribacillus composti]